MKGDIGGKLNARQQKWIKLHHIFGLSFYIFYSPIEKHVECSSTLLHAIYNTVMIELAHTYAQSQKTL